MNKYGKIFQYGLGLILSTLVLAILPINLAWPQALISAAVLTLIYFGLDEWIGPKTRVPSAQKLPAFKGEMRLAASVQEAIVTVNSRQQIIHINPAAHKLFPNTRTGASLTTISSDSFLEELVSSALSGGKTEPYVYQIHDPVERHIRVTASALQPASPADKEPRAVIVFYDVTDLERANALRADFLANASHELKTPVASLLGYIETLNGHAKDDPEARHKFLGIMQQQAQRMQRLINDILSLRNIELSEHKAPTETADLYLAYVAAKESVAPMAETKNVSLDYDGPDELLVTGKQDELVQLILNIIDNAVKMSPEGSKVVCSARRFQNWQPDQAFATETLAPNSARRRIVEPQQTGIPYAELRIRDHGPGFGSEHLPRLSERFYRIAGDRSSAEKGTGLGLAIVKHIVMRHRGGLMLETAEDVGTEFVIIIPESLKKNATDSTGDKDAVFLNFTKPS